MPAPSQPPHLNGTSSASRGDDVPLTVDWTYRLRFTTDVFAPENPVLRDVLGPPEGEPRRLLVFVDDGVAKSWPSLPTRLDEYIAAHADGMALAGPICSVVGGEACKNDRSVFDSIVAHIHDAALCRHSVVVAIGGGAVLDVVGFAAAVAHRGVRLVRLPTTTLAQDDAGMGVKNGINAFGKKNFLGTFVPPWAVINDDRFLSTLSERDWICGTSEAVKVAIVRDGAFFDEIESMADRLRERDPVAMRHLVERSARLHLEHIIHGGDPFELTEARPLDFGHWAAHKLEQMTDFDVRHGEAVAIGIALDTLYAQASGWLDETSTTRILDCLHRLGFALYHDALRRPELIDGLEEFREHLGGRLTIAMPRAIGVAFDLHEMDRDRLEAALEQLATHAAATSR